MNISFKKTDSNDPDFISLVKELDFYLALKDGEEHNFYAQFNKISNLNYCLVLYEDNIPAGCGAIKPFDADTMEVKRMFVEDKFRRKGYGTGILNELEKWAKDLGYKSTILETGKRQKEALSLYSKTYDVIPNFKQYIGVENSVCFKKDL